ncbi:MAG: hypothetical protein RQ756_00225 [Flavobacteriaceae bacterium]|nr:hypothetical protein [Flavobacteriaceae bacterium]
MKLKCQLLFSFIMFLIATSCVQLKPIPLKGEYVDKPFEIYSDKSYDVVWDNIIDLFATRGISIKLIDRSSGLIISEKTSFLNEYSFENRDGKLENQESWIVVEKIAFEGYHQSVKPDKITGEWNIRIKEINDAETLINVNLTNIEATSFYSGGQVSKPRNLTFKAKSTGKFEELIASMIK